MHSDPTRRRVLAIFLMIGVGTATGCLTHAINPSCYTVQGCSTTVVEVGLNQYDLLGLAYAGQPSPTGRIFSFAIVRGDQHVEPSCDQFEIAEAPEGAASERSWDPTATELFIPKEGDIIVFYELLEEESGSTT